MKEVKTGYECGLVFEGFNDLEAGEKTKMPNTYATSEESFAAAVNALKGIIADIQK